MARPREFDQEVVLRRAMELFWEQGYQATSLDDLVTHLGIGRASLYGTFGSKHELFLDALDLYIQERATRITNALSQPGPVLPAVRQVVNGFLSRASDPALPGCLLVNTATELVTSDPDAAERVRQTWQRLEDALAGALTRARGQQELAADADPQATAAFLVVFIQGLLVVGRGDPGSARLQQAARVVETMLSRKKGTDPS